MSHPLRLGVDIDHVATIRNARGASYPEPARAAELALAAGARTIPASPPDLKGVLPARAIVPDDEELVYEVSWSFFKIGTVRVVARRDLTADAYIDSYDGLPFVDLHSVHSTRMDTSFTPLASRSVEWKEDRWWGYHYTSDHCGRLFVDEIAQKDLTTPPISVRRVDTIEVGKQEYVDGLSIAFYPRRFVHARKSVAVPTVLYGKLGRTQFDFEDQIVHEEIDAVDHPIRCLEVHGTTSVVGVFGMTGEFSGWFSDDTAAIPLKGTLKVILGSVDVQLIRWNKPGWTPPQ